MVLRDLAVLCAVTIAVLYFITVESISPEAGALALVLAPVILGAGRGAGGCLNHLVRLLIALSLPLLALLGLLDLPENMSLRESAAPIAAILALMVALYGFYVMFGGGTRTGFWRFLALIPLLGLVVSAGAMAGVEPSTIAVLLILVLATRQLSASSLVRESAGHPVEPRFRIVWQVGSVIAAFIIFSFMTSGLHTTEAGLLTGSLVLAVVAMQGALYYIVRGVTRTIRE